jgi:Cu-Zn family superoxide dismutase
MLHALGINVHRRFVQFGAPLAIVAGLLFMPMLGCDRTKSQSSGTSNTSSGGGATTSVAMADTKAGPSASGGGGKTAMATIAPAKGAATQPSNQNVAGTVTFTAAGDGVKVVADLTGLSPGKHGFHIHEKADFSDPALASAGGHWDPDGHKKHGGPTSAADDRHAGDMGNIEAGADGKAHLEVTLPGLTIGDGGKHDIVGHAIVVHAKEDDMKAITSSGGRVAAGAIEVKK